MRGKAGKGLSELGRNKASMWECEFESREPS